MRRIASALLCFGLWLALSLPAQAAVYYPHSFILGNGMQVVVVTNKLSPSVAVMVWYKVGGSDEVAGHSGLAHYLEHLMFRGTSTMEPGAFSAEIAAEGGSDNAFTGADFTAYHEIVAADRLGMVMQMEADRMQNLQITPTNAEPELQVVLNERNQRIDNSPQGILAEKTKAALFPHHAYGIPVIGWQNEIKQATAADAAAFYQKHYAPNNAIMVVSGNVELAEVMRLATATFGSVPSREIAPRPSLVKFFKPSQKRVALVDARVEQAELEWNFIVASYSTQKSNEAYAYDVLQETLDGGEVGELYQRLVVKKQIASGVGVDYPSNTRGPATFAIRVTPQAGKDVKQLETALRQTLQQIAAQGLSEAKIQRAKQRLRRQAVFTRDSLLAPGYSFGMALTTGQIIADVENWPEHINKVTAAEVNAALRAMVTTKYEMMSTLLPDPKASPEARAAAHNTTPPSQGVGIR